MNYRQTYERTKISQRTQRPITHTQLNGNQYLPPIIPAFVKICRNRSPKGSASSVSHPLASGKILFNLRPGGVCVHLRPIPAHYFKRPKIASAASFPLFAAPFIKPANAPPQCSPAKYKLPKGMASAPMMDVYWPLIGQM